jgi:hypothetical protein
VIAVVEKGIVTSAIHNSTEKILKWVDESDGRTDCMCVLLWSSLSWNTGGSMMMTMASDNDMEHGHSQHVDDDGDGMQCWHNQYSPEQEYLFVGRYWSLGDSYCHSL